MFKVNKVFSFTVFDPKGFLDELECLAYLRGLQTFLGTGSPKFGLGSVPDNCHSFTITPNSKLPKLQLGCCHSPTTTTNQKQKNQKSMSRPALV